MKAKDILIVPLDVPDIEAPVVINQLKGVVSRFKINVRLFTALGTTIVKMVLDSGAKVFLDLKFHDIPETVGGAALAAAQLGVDMFNIHCSGGKPMMSATVLATHRLIAEGQANSRPKVFGVTLLTSLDTETLMGVGLQPLFNLEDTVVTMALAAKDCGLDGVVASPQETARIRGVCGPKFQIINPGIRMPGVKKDDQIRIGTVEKAVEGGASFLVVGRPILEAKNRLDATLMFLDEIERVLFLQAEC